MEQITTVESLGRQFRELVAKLDVDPYYKTFHTTPQHDASPHIEKEGGFCLVVTERGSEFKRVRTPDPDQILYMLLDDVHNSPP